MVNSYRFRIVHRGGNGVTADGRDHSHDVLPWVGPGCVGPLHEGLQDPLDLQLPVLVVPDGVAGHLLEAGHP